MNLKKSILEVVVVYVRNTSGLFNLLCSIVCLKENKNLQNVRNKVNRKKKLNPLI